MRSSAGPVTARVLFIGVPAALQSTLVRGMTAYGYASVGARVEEGFEPDGTPRFDVAVIDARQRPTVALKQVEALRARAPKAAIVVHADPRDSFVYRTVARMRRAVVIYGAVAMDDFLQVLDGLTDDEPPLEPPVGAVASSGKG
ncbi:MAG: hypothetical protein R3B72_46765 [Polyangiaceae bacterium]